MSQRNEYYVSCDGNDSWDGSRPVFSGNDEGPFRTIKAAKDSVRKLIEDGLNSDVIINIREGNYYLDKTLIFNELDSGTEDYRIIYKNYGDEKPVLSGGRLVSNWQHYKGNIYVTDIGKDICPYSLFENGRRGIYARYPKDGYNNAIMSEEAPMESFKYGKQDLPAILDKDNLQVYIWPGGMEGDWNWFTNTINVSSIDEKNRIIKLQEAASYELGTGSRYYIQGALDLLSEPGEFYHDKKEGRLYYYPYTAPIEEQNIVIPIMNEILRFQGESIDKTVKNIQLNNIEIRYTDRKEQLTKVVTSDSLNNDGTICIENGENIEIKYCRICNTGSHGIYLKGYAQKNLIYGNRFNDIGETGVYIEGIRKPDYFVSRNNQIVNNDISDTGKSVGHGAGIQLYQSGENTIAHNRIRNTPRYSISLKSISILEDELSNSYETKDNTLYSGYNVKNIIEYNDLSHANTDSQDTGVIEMWGGGSRNIIRNNYIHDSNVNFSFGFGIYLDDRADFCLVENNIIEGLQKKGNGKLLYAIYAKGLNDRITNNVMINNNVFRAAIGTFEMVYPNVDIEIERNIIFESGDIYYFQNWDEKRFSKCDYNLFYSTQGRYGILNEIRDVQSGNKELGGVESIKWETYNLEKWIGMFDEKFDSHSIIGNPQFRDISNKDFRLSPNSPAYKLGYEDIDFCNIGLKEDFPEINKSN